MGRFGREPYGLSEQLQPIPGEVSPGDSVPPTTIDRISRKAFAEDPRHHRQ